MNSLVATPPVLRWIVVATATVWVIGEVRQSVTRRSEAVDVNAGLLLVVTAVGLFR